MDTLRRWYFTVSRSGSETIADQIRGAVTSARMHTNLEPVCIAEGLAPDIENWLRERDVEIHYHSTPFIDRMAKAMHGKEYFNPTVAMGAYLKIYVPLYENRDEFILFTDCDVLFQRHPEMPEKLPRFLAAAPEADPNNWNYFNSGVLVFNVPNWRRAFPDFQELIEIRMRNTIFCANEQGDMNAFLWMRWGHLPIGHNWKPYWGIRDDAAIIHFHGPKLNEYKKYREGDLDAVHPGLRHMIEWEDRKSYYEHYFEKHRGILGI